MPCDRQMVCLEADVVDANSDKAVEQRFVIARRHVPDLERRARRLCVLERSNCLAIPEINQQMHRAGRGDQNACAAGVIREISDVRRRGHDQRIETERAKTLANPGMADAEVR